MSTSAFFRHPPPGLGFQNHYFCYCFSCGAHYFYSEYHAPEGAAVVVSLVSIILFFVIVKSFFSLSLAKNLSDSNVHLSRLCNSEGSLHNAQSRENRNPAVLHKGMREGVREGVGEGVDLVQGDDGGAGQAGCSQGNNAPAN